MGRRQILLVGGSVAVVVLVLVLSRLLGPDAVVAPTASDKPAHKRPVPAERGEDVPPPAPRPPADLGPGEALQLTAPDGAPLPLTVWRGRSNRAPLVLFVAAAGEDGAAWLPVLRTLRAARDTTLAVLGTQPEAGRSAPSIPDPVARRAHEKARIGFVVHSLRERLHVPNAGLALVASADAAAPVLAAAAADAMVRATALVSPVLPQDDREVLESLDNMTKRQVFLASAQDDSSSMASVQLLLQRLRTLRVTQPPGQAHGVLLLRERSLRSDLAGWLFAVLGPRN